MDPSHQSALQDVQALIKSRARVEDLQTHFEKHNLGPFPMKMPFDSTPCDETDPSMHNHANYIRLLHVAALFDRLDVLRWLKEHDKNVEFRFGKGGLLQVLQHF
jgi:hypothetical protein